MISSLGEVFVKMMFMLTNLSPPIKLFYLCQMKKTQFSFLLSWAQICFDFLSLTDHQKRIGKDEKITFWANPGRICILQSFILRICDERASIVNPHLTVVTLSCLMICLSEQYRCIIRSQVCSLCNTKIHFLIPILTVHCLQVWHMMRESVFHSPRIPRHYPMTRHIKESSSSVLVSLLNN